MTSLRRRVAMAVATSRTRSIRFIATLLLATAGGYILDQFGVPLAWMLGAMIGTAIVSLAGVHLERPVMLREIMLCVLGVAIGSAFKPSVLDGIGGWLQSLGTLSAYAILSTVAGALVLNRLVGWNRPTAFFSAVPGGLTDMMLAGVERGGDERILALSHALRIMMTVLLIPLWFTVSTDLPAFASAPLSTTWSAMTPDSVIWLTGAGIVGVSLGRLLRLPAYVFVGPMIASAAIHLGGMTAGHPPTDMVSAAQVVIGAAIGCRFVGVSLREVGRVLVIGAVLGSVLVILSGALAAAMAPFSAHSFPTLWLAFAPGGLPEMVLMSLTLGIDPAFVSTHHLYRFVFILIMARWLYRLIGPLLVQR